eukprot:2772647-Amphidinium_carterae.1
MEFQVCWRRCSSVTLALYGQTRIIEEGNQKLRDTEIQKSAGKAMQCLSIWDSEAGRAIEFLNKVDNIGRIAKCRQSRVVPERADERLQASTSCRGVLQKGGAKCTSNFKASSGAIHGDMYLSDTAEGEELSQTEAEQCWNEWFARATEVGQSLR